MMMKSIGNVIKALGTPEMESIKFKLAEKGKHHAFKDVKREHYEWLNEAFLKTI